RFEAQLYKLGEKAIQAIQEAGFNITDFAYGQRGVAGYLEGLQHKKSFIPTQRARNALTRIEAWVSQSSTQKDAIIALVQSKLQSILQEIIAYYDLRHPTYHTAGAVQQFIYAFGILTHLLASLR